MQRPSLPSLSRCPCSYSCDQSATARKSRLQPRKSRPSWAPAQQQRRYLMHTLTLTLDQAEHIDFILQTWLADAMSGGQWQLAFNYPTECVWTLEAHYCLLLEKTGTRSSSAGFRAGQGAVRQRPEDLSVLEVLLGGGAQFGAPHQQQSIHTWHIPTALIVNAANSRIFKSIILLTLHYPVSSPRVRAVHELLKLIPISCVSWSNTTPVLVQLLNTVSIKKCNSFLKF